MRQHKLGFVSALALSAVLVFAAVAVAVANPNHHAKRYTSTVTLASSNFFSGTVSSTRHNCFKSRTVRVFKVGNPTQLGFTKTDKKGAYVLAPITPPLTGEQYYATTDKKKQTSHGNQRVCRPATSPVMTVPAP